MNKIREANGCTAACNARRAIEQAALATYAARWPHYCKACHAQGFIQESNYPYEPDWTDVCETCVYENLCPRCGTHGSMDEEATVCYSCFWCINDQSALPPYVREECDCWVPTEEEERLELLYMQRVSEEEDIQWN